MQSNSNYEIEEPFVLQEIILGVLAAVGILLMVVSEVIGMMMVLLGILSVSGIYFYRIIKLLKNRGEVVYCSFSWLNNMTMILAVAGILLLMLMNVHHRLIFFFGLALLLFDFLANLIFLNYKIQGAPQLNAQVRLIVAGVLMLVFFLL